MGKAFQHLKLPLKCASVFAWFRIYFTKCLLRTVASEETLDELQDYTNTCVSRTVKHVPNDTHSCGIRHQRFSATRKHLHAQPAEAAEGQLHPPGIFQSFEIGLSDMVKQALRSLESISFSFLVSQNSEQWGASP